VQEMQEITAFNSLYHQFFNQKVMLNKQRLVVKKTEKMKQKTKK